jgi:hypothetical protein
MKSSRNTARQLFGLTLTLVGLLSWNILPIAHPELAVRAANRVRGAEPTGQMVSRAVANGRVAFVSSEGNGWSDIYSMNPDGSDRKQLTFSQDHEDQPAWSPDGTKIAFASLHLTGSGGYNEIFVMNADGSDQRRLTQSKYDRFPTWSPDGTQIAFWRIDSITMPSSWGIFVMNADGSDQRAVASTSEWYEPAWSPDGLKFAVGANYIGIYLINVDGSNQTQITQPPLSGPIFEDHAPAWSPDGSKITFIRCVDSNGFGCWGTTSHLWVVNADGSNPTKLTDTQAWSHAWSPDGTKIIFGNAQYSGGDLLVMNPDGSGLTNITNTNDKHEQSPSWQPLPLTLPNPIDDPQFFVRQHYLDFLNREPEQGGWDYWTDRITQCGSDARCIHERRIGVSAAFFIEMEFQETGYYVYRFYKASFGRQPSFAEFMADRTQVGGGANPEARKQAFADQWVQRPTFVAAYPITMSNTEFVNKVFDNAGLTASLYDPQRQQEILAMNAGRSRVLVLRDVIEIADFKNIPDPNDPRYPEVKQISQYNPAFVLMQYFGYLRRNVDSAGYAFWLDIVNNREPNNYRAMVCAFITSTEYQLRFGSVVTHGNAECGQ